MNRFAAMHDCPLFITLPPSSSTTFSIRFAAPIPT
jgi:hypothetical protein